MGVLPVHFFKVDLISGERELMFLSFLEKLLGWVSNSFPLVKLNEYGAWSLLLPLLPTYCLFEVTFQDVTSVFYDL